MDPVLECRYVAGSLLGGRATDPFRIQQYLLNVIDSFDRCKGLKVEYKTSVADPDLDPPGSETSY